MTTTVLNMVRDASGAVTFGTDPGGANGQNTTLAATVAQAFTVPENPLGQKWLAIFYFEPGSSVWVAHNTTAVLPGGSVAMTSSKGNPTSWRVSAGDTISMISNNTTVEVGIAYQSVV